MKSKLHYTLAAMLVLSGPAVLAADEVDHAAHHAGGGVPSITTPAVAAPGGADHESMKKMDAQMKAMEEMHNKMMNAKTPEQRKVLMADHMKTMQDGMKTMGGMGGMGDMGGMSKMKGEMAAKMSSHHHMMEKRMDMMEMMMRMTMDRLPVE